MVYLKLFGGAVVETDEGRVTGRGTQRHQVALLALLATNHHQTASRDKLIGVLWPESDTKHARNLLNVALYSIRRALGDDALFSIGDEVQLNGARWRVDVVDFEAALVAREPEKAVALYRGPFLDGFFLDDTPEFDRWKEAQRDRLARRYAGSLEELATGDEARREPAKAADWWRRLATHDPYDSRTALHLMRALAETGNRAAALQHAHAHAALLRADLDIEPDPEVMTLAATLTTTTEKLASSPQQAERSPVRIPTAPTSTKTPAVEEKVLPTQAASRRRSRRVLTLATVGSLALIIAATWAWRRSERIWWARNVAVEEIARLANQERYLAALRLITAAERHIPDDRQLARLRQLASWVASVRTEPRGAKVYIQDYQAVDSAWEYLGVTPLERIALPQGLLRWRIVKPGYDTLDRLVNQTGASAALTFSLHRADRAQAGMVFVPERRVEPIGDLPGYWIDRFEVTNEQFAEFLRRGGYETPRYWKHAFVDGQRILSWADAIGRLRDSTGRPGPSTWAQGTYAIGAGRLPVGGVSWYEAAAYCEFAGKSLPTIYHWRGAASVDFFYGLVQFANFEGRGPVPVGSRRTLNTLGAYDMGGNVKEWAANQVGDRRFLLGGAWTEPGYQIREPDAQRPFKREAIYGLRCARYDTTPQTTAPIGIRGTMRDLAIERPVSADVFRVYRSLYAYDSAALESEVEYVDDTLPFWRVERVSFGAAYNGERVTAHVLLPKGRSPPYQAVLWFPGAGAVLQPRAVTQAGKLPDMDWLEFVVRSGRAVVYPVYKGTFERRLSEPDAFFRKPNMWRDVVVQWSKDLGRTIDYLGTRSDIDADRIAYYGLSLGAAVAPILTALEPRIKTSILLGGGLYFGWRPPESEPLNFASRATVPVLMINGRDDFFFPLDASQRPLFRLLGAPARDKKHVVMDGGHIPRRNEIIREALDWLDQYLGPVSSRDGHLSSPSARSPGS